MLLLNAPFSTQCMNKMIIKQTLSKAYFNYNYIICKTAHNINFAH